MDKLIKNIIEETFASKKQQKYFYAKAHDKSSTKKERSKWLKMAKEFSKHTDFEHLPSEVDEIVDDKGNIDTSKIPQNKDYGGSPKETTDQAVKTAGGSMGIHGVHGTHTSLRYWAESDMSKSLGYKETLGKDKDMEDAEEYFEKNLDMDEPEADERLTQYGYDKNLPSNKVRLIENPKKYIKDYVESVLRKKTNDSDLVGKEQHEDVEKEIEPIIKKQIMSLKNTMKKNDISVEDLIKILKKEDE